MAIQPMQVVSLRPNGRDKRPAYEFEVSLDAIGNSDWIMIPEDVNEVAVAVYLDNSGATAKVQATLELLETVEADNVNDVIDWSNGIIFSDGCDRCSPPTAIRLVQLSVGTSRMLMRAQ